MQMITQPKPGDPDRSEDVLDAIQNALAKAGCILVVKDGHMVLAVEAHTGAAFNTAHGFAFEGDWRAIAHVEWIGKPGMSWRAIDWTPCVWERTQ